MLEFACFGLFKQAAKVLRQLTTIVALERNDQR